MKTLKNTLMSLVICALSALLLTSCYTVKGAFQGAAKDVAVIAGPADDDHSTTTAKKTSYNKPKQTSTARPTT